MRLLHMPEQLGRPAATPPPSSAGGVACNSLDCGVFFERRKVWFELQAAASLAAAGQAILGRPA